MPTLGRVSETKRSKAIAKARKAARIAREAYDAREDVQIARKLAGTDAVIWLKVDINKLRYIATIVRYAESV